MNIKAREAGHEIANSAFRKYAYSKLGFRLPLSFNGRVRVIVNSTYSISFIIFVRPSVRPHVSARLLLVGFP
jgi:hypothetical protein